MKILKNILFLLIIFVSLTLSKSTFASVTYSEGAFVTAPMYTWVTLVSSMNPNQCAYAYGLSVNWGNTTGWGVQVTQLGNTNIIYGNTYNTSVAGYYPGYAVNNISEAGATGLQLQITNGYTLGETRYVKPLFKNYYLDGASISLDSNNFPVISLTQNAPNSNLKYKVVNRNTGGVAGILTNITTTTMSITDLNPKQGFNNTYDIYLGFNDQYMYCSSVSIGVPGDPITFNEVKIVKGILDGSLNGGKSLAATWDQANAASNNASAAKTSADNAANRTWYSGKYGGSQESVADTAGYIRCLHNHLTIRQKPYPCRNHNNTSPLRQGQPFTSPKTGKQSYKDVGQAGHRHSLGDRPALQKGQPEGHAGKIAEYTQDK